MQKDFCSACKRNLSDEEDIKSLDVLLMLNYLLICLFF